MQTSNLEVTAPENTEKENYETISPFPLSLPLSHPDQDTSLVTERKPKVNQEGSKQRKLCLQTPSLRSNMS